MIFGTNCYRLCALVFTILVSALPAAARADGNHADAAPLGGGLSQLTFRGFRLELLTSAGTLRAGEENKVILKVQRADTGEPVKDAIVLMGVHRNEVAAADSGAVEKSTAEPLARVYENVWAGNYALEYLPKRAGAYLVKVKLLQLGSSAFDPPELLEFHLNVAPAKGWISYLPWLLMTVGIAGCGVVWVHARSRSATTSDQPFNLLELPWLGRFVLWKGFPLSLQLPVLALTLFVVLLGILDTADGARNFATRLTWIIWWPGIIVTFVLFGRTWCLICPFGTLNEQAANVTNSKRSLPRWLRAIWISTLLFLLLTWADEQLGIVRSPRMTAALIIALALAAVGTGLFFQRRSFCRYLCPITGLQGLYSMLAPIELRAAELDRCRPECRQACYRGSATVAGCPMMEFPAMMERNNHCNFCFQCVKACPKDNWLLRLRAFGKDLWASSHRSTGEAYLAFVLVGVTTVVTAQMLPLWAPLIAALSKAIPAPLRVAMKPVTYLALTESILFFSVSLIAVPLLGLAAAWAANRCIQAPAAHTKQIWVRFAYMFFPVGLAMHLAHNSSHILLEGKSIVPALLSALNRFSPWILGEPVWKVSPLVSSDVISFLQMFFVLGGLILAIIAGYRLAWNYLERGRISGQVLIPFIVVAFSITILNLYLLDQPMGARYGM
jgi:polyferredoxin